MKLQTIKSKLEIDLEHLIAFLNMTDFSNN